MMTETKVDVAIVGAGAAGCYSAFRLASERRDLKVSHFELSDRIGGRLFSQKLAGYEGSPLELGGMFISDAHQNVFRLVEKLGLQKDKVDWNDRHYYLRRKFICPDAYNGGDVPYNLADDEKGMHPGRLLVTRLLQNFDGLKSLWPWGNPKGDRKDTARYLRNASFGGRKLYTWGFWNLLNEIVSNEAYELMLSTLGVASTFRNANAYDAIWTIMFEQSPGQEHWRLQLGYDKFPLELLRAAGTLDDLQTNRRLTKITRAGSGFRLEFEDGGTVDASKVILAMPRRAIELIDFAPDVMSASFRKRDLRAVIQVPACKLFLAFDHPWWNDSEIGSGFIGTQKILASYTDLPMRQCYYFGQPSVDEPALLLATFADDVAESFWKGLDPDEQNEPGYPGLGDEPDQTLAASHAMVTSARGQLQRMHQASAAVADPRGAAFMDWGDDPYGAAWHAWAPYKRSWEVAKRVRRPNPDADLFICGEAFASPQGWVEGAINNAEAMLEAHFDLCRPAWVDKDYPFEID